jgi:hypothetical protein
MNKPAFRSTASKAAFQWDPNSDQIYSDNGPAQTLPGAAESFNKLPGKSFTMDAPEGALTLLVGSGSETTWGGSGGPTSTMIAVKNGRFTYNTNKAEADLQLGSQAGGSTNLTVENTGHFLITGFSSKIAKGDLKGYGTVTMNAKNSGFLEIDCGTMDFNSGANPRITITDKARMSVVCDGDLQLTDAFVTVSSAPDTGYSLDWASRSTSSNTIELTRSVVNFSGKASGRFRCPDLVLTSSPITASGDATCFFQFDVTSQQAGQFNLGPGSAMMQFDGYSEGALPFVYNGLLVVGVFNFATRGIASESAFRFRVLSPDTVNAILSSGTISIDNVPQYNNSRLTVDYRDDGFVGFLVKKK